MVGAHLLGGINMTCPVDCFYGVPIAERASGPPPHGCLLKAQPYRFRPPSTPPPSSDVFPPPRISHPPNLPFLFSPLCFGTYKRRSRHHRLVDIGLMPLPQGELTPLAEHLVRCTIDAVDYAMGRRSSSDIRGRRTPRSPLRTNFAEFATGVIQKSQVTLPIILVALVYIERSRPHLFVELEQWACERIFLGALVVASKVSHVEPSLERGTFLLI